MKSVVSGGRAFGSGSNVRTKSCKRFSNIYNF